MQAQTSSVRHAIGYLAESEASEGNTALGEDIWQTILEDKENVKRVLVSHMLTHGNKILEKPPDKMERAEVFEKEDDKHKGGNYGG